MIINIGAAETLEVEGDVVQSTGGLPRRFRSGGSIALPPMSITVVLLRAQN